jgi:hypothetical protein
MSNSGAGHEDANSVPSSGFAAPMGLCVTDTDEAGLTRLMSSPAEEWLCVELSAAPLVSSQYLDFVVLGSCGAVSCFVGTTRDSFHGTRGSGECLCFCVLRGAVVYVCGAVLAYVRTRVRMFVYLKNRRIVDMLLRVCALFLQCAQGPAFSPAAAMLSFSLVT